MKPPIISFVGAGSPTFTPAIFHDICLTPQLRGSHLVFYDTNLQSLANVTKLCRDHARELSVDITISLAGSLEEAIADCQFIINCAMSFNWSALDHIRKQICSELGISHPIEAQAHHSQLSFLLAVARTIERLNPRATLIQCANPIPEGGTLICRETKINYIGVCHGSRKFDQIISLLGLDRKYVNTKIAGLNHNVWLLEFLDHDIDAYPLLKQWVKQVSPHFSKYILPRLQSSDYQMSPAAISIFKAYGLFPVGDTTRASQPHMWRWHRSPVIEAHYYGPSQGRDSTIGFSSKMKERQKIVDGINQVNDSGLTPLKTVFPSGFSEWQVARIITAIFTDQDTVEMVNIPNNGAIIGLPDDLVVEIPATINSQGVFPLGHFTFPHKVWSQAIIPHWQQIENHVGAYRNHDLNLLLRQIMNNKWVTSKSAATHILSIWMQNDPSMTNHYNFATP